MKHFKLTTESKVNFLRTTLFRIELIVDCKWGSVGDKGGWVEKENNLSGDAWVSGNARVSGDAKVYGDAWVSGDAEVSGDAKVYGDAKVSGNAWVSDNAKVYGDAWVSGDAEVSGNAWVSGDAKVYGDAVCTKRCFTLNFVYFLTLTDNHIQYGCIRKTIQEWIDWLADINAVIKTPRGTPKFKLIEMSLNLAIEQWKQLNQNNNEYFC